VNLRLTFGDGGAFDFSQFFEAVKERTRQVLDSVEESGGHVNPSALGAATLRNIHLDELPAYEEARQAPAHVPQDMTNLEPQPRPQRSLQVPGAQLVDVSIDAPPAAQDMSRSSSFVTPAEPPPGYEEAQRQSVVEHLDQSLRERNGHTAEE
jgi:hypothetical protein